MSAFREAGRFPDATTIGVAVTLVALPFILPSLTLASELVVFATGALSSALLLGLVGLLSFGQGLFFGIGAYVSGVLLRDHGLGMLPAVVVGAAVAGVAAGLLAVLAVRRQGVYFVMLTMAFAQMGYFAMLALKGVTGGENGLTDVPRPPLPGFAAPTSSWQIYSLLAMLAFAAYVLVQRVGCSPFGTVLRAIRQNEARAEALGYDVRRFKIAAFALAGLVAGLAGAMHTLFLGFVPPNTIELEMSERLLIMSIIGGAGAPAGAFIGAGFYIVLSNWLSALWPRWLMLIGFLLIAIVLFLRDGLWGGAARLAARLRQDGADG
jgi:branched-chain amino acid transport system permease protein